MPRRAQPGGDQLALDLGQEWYELSNYPMVWGLFVARREAGRPEHVHLLRRAARQAEQQRGVWVRAQETTPALHEFFLDDLRVRFDDLVTASLTAFKDYLFFYDVLDEVPDLAFIEVPEDDASEEEGPSLQM